MSDTPTAFAITVDAVVLTVTHGTLNVLLTTGDASPFTDKPALPGDFVTENESLVDVAYRKLRDETSLSYQHVHLEQLATYGAAEHDPRGRVATVAYLALLPAAAIPGIANTAAVTWHSVAPLLADKTSLAFGHHTILAHGVERARSKLEYSSLAGEFCPAEFTIAQLRRVYEAVWGTRLDPRNFHRKVTGTPGFVTATARSTDGERGRPARIYTKGPATTLYPPLLRR